MPQLIPYRGRPVKRRRRVAGGLQPIPAGPRPGQTGKSVVVSES
jgi:hypothetical protein